MGFVLYALVVLSNLLVVYVLPEAQLKGFLKSYSMTSMVIGVIVVYAFSKVRWATILEKGRLPLGMCLAITAAMFPAGPALAVVYGVALLFSDYYISQSGQRTHIFIYRWFLVLSLVPAFLPLDGYREHLIFLRTYGVLLMLFSLSIFGRPIEALKIENPFFYVVATHVLYFGSLALISWTVSGTALRVWYVGAQVGQGLILKLMDYKARSFSTKSVRYQWAVYSIAIVIGAALALFSWQPLAFSAYVMSALLLNAIARWVRLQ